MRLATWTPPLYFCPWKNPLSFCVCLLDLMRHRRGIPFVTLLQALRSNWGFHAGKGMEWNTRKGSPWTCCDVGDTSHTSPLYCPGSTLFVSCCLEEELTVVGGNATKTENLQWNHLVLGQTPFCKLERDKCKAQFLVIFPPSFYQGDSMFSFDSGAGHLHHHLHNPIKLRPWHQRVITAWKLPVSLGKLLNRLRR